jgi:Flp pilus assembly CpaE family ATPase/CheY-like chemotaxis protein
MVEQTQNPDSNGVIRSCAISQELENYPLLIQEMQDQFGEGWGGLEIEDAISVLNSVHAKHMESIVLVLGSNNEHLIDTIEKIILTSKNRSIRVVIVSNDLSATALHRLMRSGADDFVPYPMPPGSLSSALKGVAAAPLTPSSQPIVQQPIATPSPIESPQAQPEHIQHQQAQANQEPLVMGNILREEPAQTHNFAQPHRAQEQQQQTFAHTDEPPQQAPAQTAPPQTPPVQETIRLDATPTDTVGSEIPQANSPSVSNRPKSGTVFPVIGAAGGTGASTFATNLAWELQTTLGDTARVCLLDFGFQFGSVGTYLDTARTDATLELYSSIDAIDEEGFTRTLSMYKDTLAVLPAPPDSVPLDIMTPNQIGRLIDLASSQFDYVVIDLPTALMSWSEIVLDRSHLMFSLLELDMRSAQNTLRFLRALKSDELPYEKVQFILNKAPKMTDLNGRSRTKRMADSLNIEFRWMLPDGGRHVLNACDQGMPLALTAARNPYRKDMNKIAGNLIELSAKPEAVKARA